MNSYIFLHKHLSYNSNILHDLKFWVGPLQLQQFLLYHHRRLRQAVVGDVNDDSLQNRIC